MDASGYTNDRATMFICSLNTYETCHTMNFRRRDTNAFEDKWLLILYVQEFR